MKRRLVVRADDASDVTSDVTVVEKRGCQIHPLGADPSFQTLTPRSLAKSVAELDALRSRVLALELKLSQNEVEAALQSAQQLTSVKKLPPLGESLVLSGGCHEEVHPVCISATPTNPFFLLTCLPICDLN